MHVLATGGTISGRRGPSGVVAPADGIADLIKSASVDLDVEIVARDLLKVDGSMITTAEQEMIARRVRGALSDPATLGVVLTHGTDSLEETAYLLDLVHDDPRPVVVTGAQSPADAEDADGPRNLADALTIATDPEARWLGAVIAFGGVVLPARGTRKTHTSASPFFTSSDDTEVGRFDDGRLVLHNLSWDRPRLLPTGAAIGDKRVDVAAVHPGGDAVALHAFAKAGAHAVVLQALGSGNASVAVTEAVRELTQQGIVVGLTTRVDRGPVTPTYGGGGGGADLVAAGAVPLGELRAGQGRMLLLALLAALEDPAAVREALPRFVG